MGLNVSDAVDLSNVDASTTGNGDVPTLVATPELSHPGESASNGLAERSVGEFMDQLRTLKTALEGRLKMRLSSNHPITHWLVEHTSYVLNKFSLGPDGHTPYGRLHGREGRERICEFGERVMWYVPKKLRAKLDQRWRYGVFLGRSMSSDQNFVGLASGDVVCARAIVRLVPEVRWDAEKVSAIRITPFEFKTRAQDVIEEDPDPHNHSEPKVTDGDKKSMRRLKLYDKDLAGFGYTEGCPRCDFVRRGQLVRARGVRHTEECRERIYDAMRKAGTEKLQRADLEGAGRTITKAKRLAERAEQPTDDAPLPDATGETPMEGLDDAAGDDLPPASGDDMFDTTNFYEEVNADVDADPSTYVEWEGEDLMDSTDDHVMSPLMDILQTVGVSAADAANYCARVIRDSPARATMYGKPYNPTFFEVYGSLMYHKIRCV